MTRRRALKVCSLPGCPNLVASGRCGRCSTLAERQRGSSAERGYDSHWRRTRADFLFENPFCSEPGCLAPATDVDHIHGDGPLSPGGHDHDRLQGFCHPHHSQKTARENGSFGRWA